MEERENAYIHGLCLANEGVGTVLDLVLGSSAELLSDLGPLVAHLSLVLSKEFVFLIGPGEMGDGGIEVVVPSRRVEESEGHVPLSALLSTTSRDGFGNSAPLSGALLRDEEAEGLVLLVGPLVHDLALLLENGSGVLRELKRLFVFCHWLDDGLIFHLQKCL